jgi:hypothetical protein
MCNCEKQLQDKLIKKEDVKQFSPCAEGYIWFLENFPQGGQLKEVYDKCPNSDWQEWIKKYFSFNPRFKDNGDNTVTDVTTGLTWIKDHTTLKGFAEEMTYSEAEEACKKLNVGGQKDWRLPSREELLSIVDLTKYDPAIDQIFTNTKKSYYWTSTPCAWDADFAWVVSFSDGYVNGYDSKGSSNYVRPVRSSK